MSESKEHQLYTFAGEMPPDEGWETPRPWSVVRAQILALELPDLNPHFLVRYIRQTLRDTDGTNAEAAWPVEFEDEPYDICGGILALGVASQEGLDAIKEGWKVEFELLKRKEERGAK
ncbi:UNVERIFIED_CONTAM: hypothetical protein HDU68_000716 [Siphonaria sp. JEL0065]|nr:hypothetical protein HDU68_000716 [Siphonaria sp. JEL0065]